jgi:hypothetical protein
MSTGENVKPQTPAENDCFQMIHDLDDVDQHVEGSVTSKKFMQSEIWSTMAYYGAPSWYITLSPADVKHPICLYFADKQDSFTLLYGNMMNVFVLLLQILLLVLDSFISWLTCSSNMS